MKMKKQSKARRRVRTRAALFLTAVSFTGLISLGLLRLTVQMNALSSVTLGAAGTLVCFLLPALAGLFLIDGDQSAMLPMRSLSAQHVLFLSLTGALLVCPMSLLAGWMRRSSCRVCLPAECLRRFARSCSSAAI